MSKQKTMNKAVSKSTSLDEEIERFNKIEARLQSLERCYNQSCSILKEQSEHVNNLSKEMKKNKIKKIISDIEFMQDEEMIFYA